MTVTEEAITLSASAKEGESAAALRIETPVKVVIASSFVLRLAGASTAIMLAAYLKQEMEARIDVIGILGALFYVVELTLAPIFGAISDLRGRRPILILGPFWGRLLYSFTRSARLPLFRCSAFGSWPHSLIRGIIYCGESAERAWLPGRCHFGRYETPRRVAWARHGLL